MSGNICRCGAYPNIVAAIEQVMQGGSGGDPVMRPFSYTRADDVAGALARIAGVASRFIAGGTNLLDLMKEDVERPTRLVDINRLNLREISETSGGGLRIGALVTNADLAYDERVAEALPTALPRDPGRGFAAAP